MDAVSSDLQSILQIFRFVSAAEVGVITRALASRTALMRKEGGEGGKRKKGESMYGESKREGGGNWI